MTIWISIDGQPVVLFGATRYYLTPAFYELLEPEQQERLIAGCNETHIDGTPDLDGDFDPLRARTD